ncbi:MAG: hypothetical protein KatS3mg004_1661 [Bryobacteraceae bacterium]|nr:MAG: hypothetical protein KatS3mg004_1661 [Bryobacteraceae bacterium]
MVEAAYAASPISEVPAGQFRASGISVYLGEQGFKTANKGTHTFLPKFGAVYAINNRNVIRGGWGMYQDTLNVSNDRPAVNGFSQTTSTPISNDAGLTFCCGISEAAGIAQGRTVMNDPFPVRPAAGNTRFDDPFGRALDGIALYNGTITAGPWNFRPALQHRWRVSYQRELMNNLMVDVSYNGAYSYIPVTRRVNALPQQYWSTGMKRNQTNDNYLNGNVTNPFYIGNLAALQQTSPTLYRFMSGQGLYTSKVIARHRLLRPYPQFSTVNRFGDASGEDVRNGYVKYHDLQLVVERRMARGLQASFMYTWASSYVSDYYLNEFDASPSERINNNVMPHRVVLTAIWQTPFGKGRTYLKQGPLAYVVGNWNLSGVWQVQSGPATNWGNRFFYGNIDKNTLERLFRHDEVRSKDYLQWFDGSIAWRGSTDPPADFVGFDGRTANQPGSYHVRMFPVRLDAIRADGIKNLDLKIERIFPIRQERGIQTRFSVDLLNAINHTNFSGPNTDPTSANFGRVTSQRGLSRVIQFNLRVDF